MPTFGENLRVLRKSRGYTQERFASVIGSTQAAVTAWERSERIPNLAMIKHIADTFKVPVSSLISMESSGIEDDAERELLDLIQTNKKVRLLLDKIRYLSEQELNVLLDVATVLTKDYQLK